MANGLQLVEEDYIDMDISSSTTFLCYTIPSPPHSREFEFQMSSHQPERETTTSPADELFYKGKLLPLHLPPRLQMVEMLLQGPTTTTAAAAATPFESCDISPANSCCVSGELNPDEYFYESSTGLIQRHSKKSWSRRLKSIKQSPLGLKVKASRAYLKSLFSKSRCVDESCAIPKAKECSDGHSKSGKKISAFGQLKSQRHSVANSNATTIARSIDEGHLADESFGYRRSFSGVIKWYSTSKSSVASSSCSSSSSSSSSSSFSSGTSGPQMLKRSSSVNSEVESSIQGAIAYCKSSQQPVCARKSVSDVGLYSLSASRAAAAFQKQDRPGLGRG